MKAFKLAQMQYVTNEGEQFLLILYGAGKFATLNKYRYVAYTRSVAKSSVSSSFKMASLPTTSAADQQHSYMSISPGPTVVGTLLASQVEKR